MSLDGCLSETKTIETEGGPGNYFYLSKVVCNMTVYATMHGNNITCEIFASDREIYGSSSSLVTVQYDVRNTSYTPQSHQYKVGEVLVCNADGNPPPVFEWEDEKSGRMVKQKWINITDDMEGKNSWRCIALNNIRGIQYNKCVAVTFYVDTSTQGLATHAIIIITVVLLVIVLASMLFGILHKKNLPCKCSKNDTSPEMGVDGTNNERMPILQNSNSWAAGQLENLQKKEDFDYQGEMILEAMDAVQQDLENNPLSEMFLKMVMKAPELFESKYYLEIIQKLADIYKPAGDKPAEGPLMHVIKIMNNKKRRASLFEDQNKTLLFFQILVKVDDSEQSKNRFLMSLITWSEYVSKSKHKFSWTKQFISTLNRLLERGADPTWITKDWRTMERRTRYTAQYKFFWATVFILAEKNNLYEELLKLLPMIMQGKSSKTEYLRSRGSPLHALMEFEWGWLNEKMKKQQHQSFFKQLKVLIKAIINHDNACINNTDWRGRTPLHMLLENIELQEGMVKSVNGIVDILKSNDIASMQDNKGQTILHYLAEAFPIFKEHVSQHEQDKFLDIVKNLVELHPASIDIVDDTNQTALHLLARKYNLDLLSQELFVKLAKCFSSNCSMTTKDSEENSPLDILLLKFHNDIPIQGLHAFCEVIGHLCSNKSEKEPAVLHLVAEKYSSSLPEHCKKLLSELLKQSAIAPMINMTDKQGQTVLHILARKVCFDPSLDHDLLSVFLIIAKGNVNILDNHSVTPFTWILKGKLQRGQKDLTGMFEKVEQIFKDNGADKGLATSGLKYANCMIKIQMLHTAKDLDIHKQELLDMLKEHENDSGQGDPEILQQMVQKASSLIASESYIDVITCMANVYAKTSYKPKEGPLQCLLNLMVNKSDRAAINKHQTKMNSLLQILTRADEDKHSRNKVLKALLTRSKYASKSKYSIEWMEEFIQTLKVLLETADPTWLPEDWDASERRERHTAQYSFFSAIPGLLLCQSDLFDSIRNILPLFKTKNSRMNSFLRGSSLHALVEIDWKWLKNQLQGLNTDFFDQYKQIISEVNDIDPAHVDNTDWCGRTPLHIFIQSANLEDEFMDNIKGIIKLLTTDVNVNKPDHNGQTVMHYLVNAYFVYHEQITENGHKLFFNLIDILKHKNADIDHQDENCRTVLHIIARMFCLQPHSGDRLLSMIDKLITSENVNVVDKNSMTPFSWILQGRKESNESIFLKILAKFQKYEVDEKLASKGLHKSLNEFSDMIGNIHMPEDLENCGTEMKERLTDAGNKILLDDPDTFLKMVQKADILIGAPIYIDLVEKMAEIYQNVPDERKGRPLQCILELMSDTQKRVSLFKNEAATQSLIRALIPIDKKSRNEFLMSFITWAEYISKSKYTFKWNEDFIDTLKVFIENGVDPMWITSDWGTLERRTRYTAQYKIFRVLFSVLVLKEHLFEKLKCVLASFLTFQHPMAMHLRGSALHALMEIDWEWLIKQLEQQHRQPADFFHKFEEIIRKVTSYDGELVDSYDWCGRTPLHLYMQDIVLKKDMFEEVHTILNLLKTEENLCYTDNNGQTILHYVAKAFPIVRTAISLEELKPLLNIVKDLVSRSKDNVNVKDNDSRTALHLLAEKCDKGYPKMFCAIVEILMTQSNIDIKDKEGETALHIIARKICSTPKLACNFLPILPRLITSETVNAMDNQSVTPFSWILEAEKWKSKEDALEEVVDIFKKEGADTALARKRLNYIQDNRASAYNTQESERTKRANRMSLH